MPAEPTPMSPFRIAALQRDYRIARALARKLEAELADTNELVKAQAELLLDFHVALSENKTPALRALVKRSEEFLIADEPAIEEEG